MGRDLETSGRAPEGFSAAFPLTAIAATSAAGSDLVAFVSDRARSGPTQDGVYELEALRALPPDLHDLDCRMARICWASLSKLERPIDAALRRWGSKRFGLVVATAGGFEASLGRPTPEIALNLLERRVAARGPSAAVVGHASAGVKALVVVRRWLCQGAVDAGLVVGAACLPPWTPKRRLPAGEGSSAILIERQAEAEVELRAAAISRGSSSTARAVRAAVQETRLDPRAVAWTYVDSGGTVDDDRVMEELGQVLPRAFRNVVTSGAHGDLGPATALYQTSVAATALEHGWIPPSWVHGPTEARPREGRAQQATRTDGEAVLVAVRDLDEAGAVVLGAREP